MKTRAEWLSLTLAIILATTACMPKKSGDSTTKEGAGDVVCDIGNNWWLYMLAGALTPAASVLIGTTLAVTNGALQKSSLCNGKPKPPTMSQLALILRDEASVVTDDAYRGRMEGLLTEMQAYNPAPPRAPGQTASNLGDDVHWASVRILTADDAISHWSSDVDQLDRWALAWTMKLSLYKMKISQQLSDGNIAAEKIDIRNLRLMIDQSGGDRLDQRLSAARTSLTRKAVKFFAAVNRRKYATPSPSNRIEAQMWCRDVQPLSDEESAFLDSFANPDDAPASLKKRRAFASNGPICKVSEDDTNKAVNDKINEISRDLQKDLIDNSIVVNGLLQKRLEVLKAADDADLAESQAVDPLPGIPPAATSPEGPDTGATSGPKPQ